jgi:predicted secreted protein
MFYDNDEDVFFADFSRSVNYTPAGGVSAAKDVIYDAAGSLVQMSEGVTIRVTAPQVTVRDSDFVGVKMGDAIEIDGITYYIRDKIPDGTGMSVFILSVI